MSNYNNRKSSVSKLLAKSRLLFLRQFLHHHATTSSGTRPLIYIRRKTMQKKNINLTALITKLIREQVDFKQNESNPVRK